MTKSKYKYLKEKNIINWCWWQWGFSISKLYRDTISQYSEYDKHKACKLLENIELQWCWPHDVRYYNWNKLYYKIYADLCLSCSLFRLTNWTNIFIRISLFSVVFIWLTFKWWKYFNKGEKKNILF